VGTSGHEGQVAGMHVGVANQPAEKLTSFGGLNGVFRNVAGVSEKRHRIGPAAQPPHILGVERQERDDTAPTSAGQAIEALDLEKYLLGRQH
jgi:hypothetical protein